MTKNEAEERAQRIWDCRVLVDPVRGVVTAQSIQPVDEWFVQVATDKRFHGLDTNGHVTCHDDCKMLEVRLGGPRGVADAMPLAPSLARAFSAWHEDDHDVLWWHFPISEPPYVGSPLASDWPFTKEDESRLGWTKLVVPSGRVEIV